MRLAPSAMRQRRWGRPHRGHAWSAHAKRPLELAFQRAFHEEFLVPTARLELAQLSPLPPQDSVSTNFTTSASQKSSAFLESRTFYHAIAASRQFVPARRSPRRCRTGPSRSGNKPLQARRPLASICHVARQYWHPHAHTRGCSRGISSGYSYEREFVGAHAWPAYDASHTQQGLRPVERFHHATSDLPHSGSSPHAARRPAQFAPLRRRFVAAGLPRSAPAARIR